MIHNFLVQWISWFNEFSVCRLGIIGRSCIFYSVVLGWMWEIIFLNPTFIKYLRNSWNKSERLESLKGVETRTECCGSDYDLLPGRKQSGSLFWCLLWGRNCTKRASNRDELCPPLHVGSPHCVFLTDFFGVWTTLTLLLLGPRALPLNYPFHSKDKAGICKWRFNFSVPAFLTYFLKAPRNSSSS